MAKGNKLRVLIADDSAFMRKVLQSILASDPDLEVIGEARDGRDCIEKTANLNPDVITMDINMPIMDGLQATEQIMSSNPKPIVVVSSESRQGAEITLKALELGAIDFVAKPSSNIDLDMNTVRDELIRKIKVAAKVRVVRTAVRSKLGQEIAASAPRTEPSRPGTPPAAPAGAAPSARPVTKFPIVVIAASTGGPATLSKLIPRLPKDYSAAVILVQHMPGAYTAQYSQQLSENCQIKVKEAEPGEIVAPGTVYVCPGTHHLRVSATGRFTLDDGPRISGYRPCADVALETVSEYAGPMTIGVILTGMGSDGVRGAQMVKKNGGWVIAQDEATSVIYGMNAEAIKAGTVDQILPVDDILPAVDKRILYVYGAQRVGAL